MSDKKREARKRGRRVDMEAIPEVIPPIPDTFENVIQALLKPAKPKPADPEDKE